MVKTAQKMSLTKRADERERAEQAVQPPNYSEEELAYRNFLISRLEQAARQRESNHVEFDDRPYTVCYDENRRLSHSYNRPKKNPEDVRIVTGTTQEKEVTLLSSILNYNFKPDIQAFDKQNVPYVELGIQMKDLVDKSREIEGYDDKRRVIYKEMLDQGTVFVEEIHSEQWRVDKKIADLDFIDGVDPAKINWTARLKKAYGMCECKLLSGKKVFLGNIREFFVHKQPYIFTTEYVPYAEVAAVYSKWERWKNVPRKVVKISWEDSYVAGANDQWVLQESEMDLVEVIKYQDPWSNEYMIMLNGVMMLPIAFPLSFISPAGCYTIAKGDTEPIAFDFAYSKSFPAKTKVDQRIKDEFYRLMILKTRQSYEPPLINNTNSAISRRIFNPGKITPNVDINNLHMVLQNQQLGITQAEIAAMTIINENINEKTASPVFSGDKTAGDPTATEIREMQKQQMVKMGLVMLGVLQLEKQLVMLRIKNILANYTSPVGNKIDKIKQKLVDIYQSYSVETTDEQGMGVLKIIEMNPEMAASQEPDQIRAEEDMLSDVYGRQVRKVYMDPNKLKETLEDNWFVTITPTERDTTDLDRVLFSKTISDAQALFGPQTLNYDYAKRRFATLSKEDPNQFFVQQGPMSAMNPGMDPNAPAGGGGGAPAKPGAPVDPNAPQPRKPSGMEIMQKLKATMKQ